MQHRTVLLASIQSSQLGWRREKPTTVLTDTVDYRTIEFPNPNMYMQKSYKKLIYRLLTWNGEKQCRAADMVLLTACLNWRVAGSRVTDCTQTDLLMT